eukprot:symbB.v1.2.030376.t1/scaffold3415.1/size57235/2
MPQDDRSGHHPWQARVQRGQIRELCSFDQICYATPMAHATPTPPLWTFGCWETGKTVAPDLQCLASVMRDARRQM